jgi:hypothetical protein
MIAVASLLFSRFRLIGAILLLLALLAGRSPLAIFQSDIAAEPQSQPAASATDAGQSAFTAAGEEQWIAFPADADDDAAGTQFQVPVGRLVLTFGDSTWDAVVADQVEAVVIAGRRQDVADAAGLLAPLWASLQVRKIRLQV